MMKKKLLSGLLIFFSAILLSACNSGKTEQNDDVDNTPEDRTVIVAESDNFDEEWYQNKYYMGNKSDWLFFVNEQGNNLQFGLDTRQIAVLDKSNYEIVTSDEYGKVVRYYYTDPSNSGYECRIDYLIDRDEVIIGLFQMDSEYTELFTYYGERSAENNTTTDNAEVVYSDVENIYFFDGQRFECFETASGEDIILTIHLFTDEDGNTTAYKGELSNGIEFWFEYASTENDVVIYNVDYALETAELVYYTNSSELYFLTNGNALNNYGGMYIALPDIVEE